MEKHKPWEVGEKVVVVRSGALSQRTISRVLVKFIELDDGSKWRNTSYPDPYPYQKGYWKPHVRRPLEGDDILFKRQYLSRYLGDSFLKACNDDEVCTLYDVLRSIRKAHKDRASAVKVSDGDE